MAIDTSLPKDIRILQAAEEVFSQHGYEKATLDEIIALADVGKGTVYKYFGNKEHLFYKLVADKNAPFLEKLHQAIDSADSFEDKLKKYFEVMVHFYVANSTALCGRLSALKCLAVPMAAELSLTVTALRLFPAIIL